MVSTAKGPAMPVSAGTGTDLEAQGGGSSSGQLPVCRKNGTLAPPRTQETGASVRRGRGAAFAGLAPFLPPLHFLLMTRQLIALVQTARPPGPCSAVL